MKKGMLPTQEYELISIVKQNIDYGTPLICDDCGKLIFNIATIKGKQDGKIYSVGLTCVKKLLNKSIYFDLDTKLEYDRQVHLWDKAMNCRKWIEKRKKENLYNFRYDEFFSESDNDTMCFVELTFKENNHYAGNSAFISTKYKSVFNGLF